jgi:hypothetical protein
MKKILFPFLILLTGCNILAQKYNPRYLNPQPSKETSKESNKEEPKESNKEVAKEIYTEPKINKRDSEYMIPLALKRDKLIIKQTVAICVLDMLQQQQQHTTIMIITLRIAWMHHQ